MILGEDKRRSKVSVAVNRSASYFCEGVSNARITIVARVARTPRATDLHAHDTRRKREAVTRVFDVQAAA